MKPAEWNPFRDIFNVGREIGNFFPDFGFRPGETPRVDIYQTNTDVVIKAEIPGISREDLDVYIDENSIRLSGQTRRNNEFKDENIYRSERYYGSFSRTIPLPAKIKSDLAKAEYQDGILTITAPKTEPTRNTGRKLDIQ